MGDLEAYTEKKSPIPDLIYAWHKSRGDSEPPRTYLGASIIGEECSRKLWYDFRHCFKHAFSGRMYRLFETGKLEEARFVAELRAIGLEVVDGEETGQQIAVECVEGHFRGHLDGAAKGVPEAPETWHVLEFKTHSDKSFKELVSKGVMLAKPMHYAQMMVYMGLTGMTRALYVAKNKDTDEIYCERIRYSSTEYVSYIRKAELIIYSANPLERCATRPDDFRCRFCDAKTLCWGLSTEVAVPLPFKSCRTCCHSTPEKSGDGAWSCGVGGEFGTPCDKHLIIPSLIHFAEPSDAGDGWISFETASGMQFTIGVRDCDYTYEDMTTSMGPLGYKKPDVPDFEPKGVGGIFDKYPPEDSRLLWEGKNDGRAITAAMDNLGICYDTAEFQSGTEQGLKWHEFSGKYLLVTYDVEGLAYIFEGVE